MILLRRIGFLLAAIVILIALAFVTLPMTIPLGLRIAGIDDVTYETIEIGLRHARIEALAIGQPANQNVATIEADYSFGSLFKGRIDRLRIDGMAVEAAYRDGVFSIGDAALSDTEEPSPNDDDAHTPVPPFLVENLLIENSRVDIETPAGMISVPIDVQAALADDRLQFDLDIPNATLTEEGSERLDAGLTLSGHLPLSEEPTTDQLAASGKLLIRTDGIFLPGVVEEVDANSEITLSLADGRLTLSGPVVVTSPAGSVDGELKSVVALDGDMKPMALEDTEATFDLRAIAVADIGLDRGWLGLELAGKLDKLTGAFTLDLEGLNASLDGIDVHGVNLQRVLDLTIEDDVVEIRAQDEGEKISVDQVAVITGDEPTVESGWFTIQWPGRDQPWLRFSYDEQTIDLDWKLELDPVRIDTGDTRLWARIEDLAVQMSGSPEGILDGAIRIRQGRADLPSANLALTGIESDFLLQDNALAVDQPLPLTIRAIRPLDEPRLFSAFRFDAQLKHHEPTLAFDGTLSAVSSPSAVLKLTGSHDTTTNQGKLDLDLAPLRFDNALQPADLSPILDGVISDAVGGIDLDGHITWDDGRLDSDIQLLIEELGFAIGPARLSRVNSVLRFDGIMPVTTPKDQLLSVGLLDVGLPLTDGLVSMHLKPDGQLSVDQLEWRLAEGRIRSQPFTFGSDVQSLTLLLKAEQLDLNALLAQTPLDELTGEGLIDGTLPLTIGEAAAIEDGELAASGPGVLRYTPSSVPGVLQAGGESVTLMLKALENFHYEALRISLDGRTDGATAIGLHLKGANPDLYDAHPVEFNLNLEGNLADLIQTNLDNYQIPDRIRERLQRFER